ncbi:hypothetical protein Ccrd_011446, partial [Cynara cardunculus var. scolymus]
FTEVEPPSHQLFGKHDAALSDVLVVEKSNGDSFGKTYESIQDLGCTEDLTGTKKINSKMSDGESSVSKSDVVDALVHPDKCEDFSTSTTSILREQTIMKCESDTIDNHLEHNNHKNTISQSDLQPVSEEVMQDGFPSPRLCTSYSDNKVGSEDPLSECCGSDVTQDEQGHMAEGDTTDKVQVGYDSPFEDGELREPIGWEENEVVEKQTIYYESDNTYKNDYGTIENSLPERIKTSHDHGQAMEDHPSLLVKEAVHNNDKQGAQADILERPNSLFEESDCGSGKEISGRKTADGESRQLKGNSLLIDESTSIDGCRNGAYIRHSRSSNIGDYYSRSGRDLGPCVDSSMRNCDLKSSHEYHRPRNGNLDPVARSGGCRSLDSHQFRSYDPRAAYRRPSPSERNNGYGVPRGPPVRSLSRDRYRGGSGFHPQGLRRTPDEEYHERKIRCFSPNFNRPGRRSRSRSRSGSPPIAWHFQKQRNLDTDDEARFPKPSSNSSEIETCDDRRLIDKKRSTVAMIRRTQRFESIGYPERLKSDDHFRITQRSGRFSQPSGPHIYKDHGDSVKKHDGHYEKSRRFRYMADRNLDRDGHGHGCLKEAAGGGMVTGESKSEEKGRSSVSRFSQV